MDRSSYPALYVDADAASGNSQKAFLSSIKAEYALLILAAVFGVGWFDTAEYQIAYAVAIFAPLVLLIARSHLKPEQRWYKSRAIAESVKTLTWRYMMRADPFDDPDDQISAATFRNRLKTVLQDSKHIGEDLAISMSVGDQVTPEMRRVRALPISDRITLYIRERVDSQRIWYGKKAAENRTAGKRWVLVGAALYVAAIIAVLFRIAHPSWQFLEVDILLVAAAAVVGWMQIKKHNELSSSYALTAHEIGAMKLGYEEVQDEKALSEFVNEAERAFSREHTQWGARRE